ncbi:MAG: dihydrolipoyl dehydrogenase [Rhodospirillales bacterium]|nr:dihydrolipoyl dehydrogenase [Rhodospirillales bacterium]MCB9973871.1 dihydrolipoyl dehydrogenase [Rhodospirillales bacterium]
MSDKNFDVIVIGGGPGGYVAAIRAAQLKMKVALVERAHLGGICLNWGCIPTKALLRTAEVYRLMNHAGEFGLSVSGVSFDLQKVVERSRGVASQLSGGIKHLLKKNKVTVFDGTAKLKGKGKISVNDMEELSAKHIILATGARARVLPGLEPDGELIVTYKDAMTPKTMPKRLLVVGSGAIGIEFASFYRTLGADVTVVEVLDRVMPVEDEEISKLAQKSFEKQGMKIITGGMVKKLEKSKTEVTAHIEVKGKIEPQTFDRVILAVGIQANTENLGLEQTKVKLDRGHIITNEWLQTDEPGVYAIGDVTGGPWLAHKASHEGVICVEKIAGLKDVHPMKKSNIPGCTYCHPQVASVGLTEAKAKEQGYEVKVGRFPFIGNGKAIALGEPEGLVKTVFDAKTGELLGAHMIGAEVTELIQGYVIGKTAELVEADFMHTIFPHPTLSEMMHESVLDAYGRAIHF